jgi:apolipoprotein N-acyltransferase
MTMRWAVVITLVAGVLLALAFPPLGFGPYAIVAVALLTWAIRGHSAGEGFLLGALAGFVFFALHMYWLTVVGIDAWLLLALYCAMWIGIIGWGTALVTRLPVWPLWVAALWVASEAFRGRVPFGGYPWGRLAFSQAEDSLGNWSYWLGMAGLTAVIALIGSGVVLIATAMMRHHRSTTLSWSLIVVLLFVIPAAIVPLTMAQETLRSVPVGYIQGGTPQLGMGALDVRRVVLNNHVEQTRLLAEDIDSGRVERPAFVLWPENATDIDPFVDEDAYAAIQLAAEAVNVPIVVGAVINNPDNPNVVRNVGIVWDPQTGPGQLYIKTRPVPFGEFIPFRSQLAPFIGRFDRIPRDFEAGSAPGVLDVGGVVIGDAICFEVAYDEVMNTLVREGAELLVVQTNNATYGNTAQPAQQFDIERLRAIEAGRSLVVAATTGISAAIAPNGEVLSIINENAVGHQVTRVPIAANVPPGSILGPWLEGGLVALAIASLISVPINQRIRYRRG